MDDELYIRLPPPSVSVFTSHLRCHRIRLFLSTTPDQHVHGLCLWLDPEIVRVHVVGKHGEDVQPGRIPGWPSAFRWDTSDTSFQ